MKHPILFKIFLVVFLMMKLSADDAKDKIDKLAIECSKGIAESCKMLADIARKDIYQPARMYAVAKLADQEVLIEIAKKDKDEFVRASATQKLVDQTTLSMLARKDQSGFVRMVAASKLNDQLLLAEIARTDEDKFVRKEAVFRITNPAVLNEITKTEKDNYVRVFLAANKHCPNGQALLADFATDPSSDIRRIVAEYLIDQVSLAKIAKMDNNSLVILKSLERITNQILLADIAKTASDKYTRGTACRRLTDPSVLNQIAKNDADWWVRFTAAANKNCPNRQTALSEIAKNSPDHSVREQATGELTDQLLLANIAKNDTEPLVRFAAVGRMTDQAALAELARTASDEYIRRDATEKLSDQKILVEIAKNDPDVIVRDAASRKLITPDLLAEVSAFNKKTAEFDEQAEKSYDQLLLTEIATTSPNEKSRLTATKKLTNPDILAKVAKYDKSQQVRLAAIEKLYLQAEPQPTSNTPSVQLQKLSARTIRSLGPWISSEETAKVTDQVLLLDIVKNACEPAVIRVAILKCLSNIAGRNKTTLSMSFRQKVSETIRNHVDQFMVGVGDAIANELLEQFRKVGPNAIPTDAKVDNYYNEFLAIKNLSDRLIFKLILANPNTVSVVYDSVTVEPGKIGILNLKKVPYGTMCQISTNQVKPTMEFAAYRAAQALLAANEIDAAKELLKKSCEGIYGFQDACIMLDSLDPSAPRGEVTGRLVDSMGKPVSGGNISLHKFIETWLDNEPWHRLWLIAPSYVLIPDKPPLETTTDISGNFIIKNVPIGFYSIVPNTGSGVINILQNNEPIRIVVSRKNPKINIGDLKLSN